MEAAYISQLSIFPSAATALLVRQGQPRFFPEAEIKSKQTEGRGVLMGYLEEMRVVMGVWVIVGVWMIVGDCGS